MREDDPVPHAPGSRPEWWQDVNAELEENGIDTYHPPVFKNGTLKHDLIDQLERELDVSIRFVTKPGNADQTWLVEVDGEMIGSIDHYRSQRGFTVYQIAAPEFAHWIRQSVSEE